MIRVASIGVLLAANPRAFYEYMENDMEVYTIILYKSLNSDHFYLDELSGC